MEQVLDTGGVGLGILAFVATTVALVMSIVTRRRNPRTKPVLQFALGGLFLYLLMPELVNAYRMTGAGSYGLVRAVLNFVSILFLIAGIVLLILALFVRRPAEQPAPPARPPWQPPQQQYPPQPQQQPYQPYGPGQYR